MIEKVELYDLLTAAEQSSLRTATARNGDKINEIVEYLNEIEKAAVEQDGLDKFVKKFLRKEHVACPHCKKEIIVTIEVEP